MIADLELVKERELIGGLLDSTIRPETTAAVREIIPGRSAFKYPAHGALYALICRLAGDGSHDDRAVIRHLGTLAETERAAFGFAPHNAFDYVRHLAEDCGCLTPNITLTKVARRVAEHAERRDYARKLADEVERCQTDPTYQPPAALLEAHGVPVRRSDVLAESVASLWSTGATFVGEPPARDWLVYNEEGGGLLARGKVAILASSGGVGKTFALIGMGLALATDTPWLGVFPVDNGPKRQPRVAVILGEEDTDEIHRWIHSQSRAMNLDPEYVKVRLRTSLFLGGAGQSLALVETDRLTGQIVETERSKAFRAFLEREGRSERGGFDCVLLDPLSRFGGADMEKDNAAATRVIEVLERYTKLPGSPTVLVAHHFTKDDTEGVPTPFVRFAVTKSNYGEKARADLATRKGGGIHAVTHSQHEELQKITGTSGKAGSAAVRGSSALVDGARWVATLTPVYQTADPADNGGNGNKGRGGNGGGNGGGNKGRGNGGGNGGRGPAKGGYDDLPA